MKDNKEKIRGFLERSLKNQEVTDEIDIFTSGFVNSLFAMQLIMFVEQEFAIEVNNEDLDIDNFRTINAIAYFVDNKTNAQLL